MFLAALLVAASKPSRYHPYHLTTDLGPSHASDLITQPKASPVSLAFAPQEQPKPHQARLTCGVGTYAVLSESQSAVVVRYLAPCTSLHGR